MTEVRMRPRGAGGTAGATARVLLLLAAAVAPVQGQSGPGASEPSGSRAFLPVERYFEDPRAAPREPRFTASVVSSDLLVPPPGAPGRPDFGLGEGAELQGIAGMGGSFPLWRPARWADGGLTVGIQTGIYGRFRLENTANELLGTDWLVALPLETRRGRLSARARLLHWSAHLGDEYADATDARRLDFTHEAVDLVVAWSGGRPPGASSPDRPGPRRRWSVYAGGGRVLRSQLEDASDAPPGFTDDGHLQLGGQASWTPWGGGRLGLQAALDLQWADRTDGRRQIAGSAGFVGRDGAGRSYRVGLVVFDGPSPLGQFFQNDESYWGLEIRIDP